MTTPSPIPAWERWMIASGNAPGTVHLRARHLHKVLTDLRATSDPLAVTPQQLIAYMARQRVRHWSATTARSYRASLRSFYGWARDARLIEVSPAHELPRVKIPRQLPKPTPEDAYKGAVAACGDPYFLLALLLAGQCGLRRFEIAKARREDVTVDLIGHSLRVVGKGGHERLVPLTDELAGLILAKQPGWLFPSPRRPGAHATPAWLSKRVSEWLPGSYTTHSLRHRCATVALEATKDLRAVQELLGHASPDTTAVYTLISGARVRAAMEAAA